MRTFILILGYPKTIAPAIFTTTVAHAEKVLRKGDFRLYTVPRIVIFDFRTCIHHTGSGDSHREKARTTRTMRCSLRLIVEALIIRLREYCQTREMWRRSAQYAPPVHAFPGCQA